MIAVLGASGQIGRLVAVELAERGARARALVRDPARAALPLESLRADLTDPASLGPALRGASQLFLLTPHHPDQDLLEVAAVEAALDAGVDRIVKLSGGAATLGPSGATATATAHWRSEQLIERSGVDFTFLRPSFFAQNLLTTIAPIVAATGVLAAPFGRAAVAMVDARDVAACAVAALLAPGAPGQAWQLTGPRPVTFDDIAARLGVRYLPIPRAVAGRGLSKRGASHHEVEHAMRMAKYFAAGSDGAATDHVMRLTGAPPRPVEALLDEHRSAFRPATRLARTIAHLPTKDR